MRQTVAELFDSISELLHYPAAPPGEYLVGVQPYDLSVVVTELPGDDARRLLAMLEPPAAAEVLEHLEYIQQYRLLRHLPEDVARPILDQMSSDAVVDLAGAIHPRQAEQLLSLLPTEYAETVRGLMAYPENSAGGRMTVDYVSVRQTMTVAEVLNHIRKVGREAETVSLIYVVDAAGRLTGVASLRELILAHPQTPIAEVMNDAVVSVPAAMDQEAAARIVSQYDFVAVPVVSQENRLLGIITVDDVIDVLQEEATEDIYQLGAVSVPEEPLAPSLPVSAWELARPRLPWLVSLLFLEMGSSFIVERFSGLVAPATAVMLALFTVVMAGESGNAATQALAVVVRGLATGEIEADDMPRVVLREALVGVIVGVVVGGTLLLTGWLWQGSARFGLAIGGALAANLFIAKVLGGLFPVVIHRLGIDPAVASGPFITTLTDNTSMLVYYGVAALVLRGAGVG
ncbi:MAG TPA: magnesium transporter [Symbiobacteriaceae bacterium]|nr:magnesium transporter [Symbiobacteriaceae bacterium]